MATGVPVLLHDDPLRCAQSLSAASIRELAEVPGIVGICDAIGDEERLLRLKATNFVFLTGRLETAGSYLALGGTGCVSSAITVFPHIYRETLGAVDDKMLSPEMEAVKDISALVLGDETPATLKYVLSLMGHMQPDTRLPIVPPSRQVMDAIARSFSMICR